MFHAYYSTCIVQMIEYIIIVPTVSTRPVTPIWAAERPLTQQLSKAINSGQLPKAINSGMLGAALTCPASSPRSGICPTRHPITITRIHPGEHDGINTEYIGTFADCPGVFTIYLGTLVMRFSTFAAYFSVPYTSPPISRLTAACTRKFYSTHHRAINREPTLSPDSPHASRP